MTTHTPEGRRIVAEGLSFLEAPRWRDGRLYLSDMHDHRVLTVGGDGAVDVVVSHEGALSGLGWLPDGTLLVVDMAGLVLRQDGDRLVTHADLRPLAPFGINDMITHEQGWSWVGQFGYDREHGAKSHPSPLLRVDPDGSVREAADDLWTANGMGVTDDGRTLVVAESGGKRISTFRIGDDGALHDRRLFAQLPDDHFPDGMCLDAEGAVWVACVHGGRFLRVHEGGIVSDEVLVEEGRHPIACVLGDADRRTLYLLTAVTLGEAEPSRATRAARVEAHRVDVPGAGRP